MKKVSIFLAEGFEEVEALTPADVLRRAGAEVTLVAVGGKREVAGSHGIIITADCLFEDMDFADMDLLLLPGGMPGTLHLKECSPLVELLKEFCEGCGHLRGAHCTWRSRTSERQESDLLSGMRGRPEGSRSSDRPCGD